MTRDAGVEIVLGLGTNLGDRLSNLRRGLALLATDVLIERVSSLFETTPWGVADQPDFLNAVVLGSTRSEPHELLGRVKAIEVEAGRTPDERWGPRLLDIDILYYDDLLLDDPDLQIPHPRIGERAFVLVPLAEVGPNRRDARTGRTVVEMLASIDRSGMRYAASADWVRTVTG